MKTILITGSTDGIGKLAAMLLAKEQHQVYLHGRNPEKLAKVVEEVKSLSKNEHVKGFTADFSDLQAVGQMAEEVRIKVAGLDVLINNAGVFNSPVDQVQGGMDIRFVVNYLAPFALTNALLPLLQQRPGSRIINLSSAAQAPVSLSALTGNMRISVQGAYAQSKLALTMWSFHLARQLPETAVIAVNPGSLLNTRMVREAFGEHWAPAEKGAQILYELADLPAYADASGKYFDNDLGGFGRAHAEAYDEVKVKRLLETTESLLGRT